jgi:shikimate kinase
MLSTQMSKAHLSWQGLKPIHPLKLQKEWLFEIYIRMLVKNIVLIGFMGSGKSFIGKKLAKKLDINFLDMDELIEKNEGVQIRQIFTDKGEGYFRDLECKLFENLCQTQKNSVISTGGGAPTVIADLKPLGLVVYLKIDFENLLERLKAEEFDKRPLFQNIDFARELFNKREPIYASKADIIIDAMLTPDEIIKIIMDKC